VNTRIQNLKPFAGNPADLFLCPIDENAVAFLGSQAGNWSGRLNGAFGGRNGGFKGQKQPDNNHNLLIIDGISWSDPEGHFLYQADSFFPGSTGRSTLTPPRRTELNGKSVIGAIGKLYINT